MARFFCWRLFVFDKNPFVVEPAEENERERDEGGGGGEGEGGEGDRHALPMKDTHVIYEILISIYTNRITQQK